MFTNLHQLNQVMETGQVTDMNYFVPGNFIQQQRESPPPGNESQQADSPVDPEIAALRAALAEGWAFRE